MASMFPPSSTRKTTRLHWQLYIYDSRSEPASRHVAFRFSRNIRLIHTLYTSRISKGRHNWAKICAVTANFCGFYCCWERITTSSSRILGNQTNALRSVLAVLQLASSTGLAGAIGHQRGSHRPLNRLVRPEGSATW